ncbi:MAG TPA: 1-deoxy-D-xylulose-5-phosphate reductoisomerase [Afifellaceae bacterium]|nr:1-deoxy-D-xylulose-5-phosphate reductoisomerase [Afifellaceae bacterium]
MTRRVTIIGATGSVGASAVEVISADPAGFAVHAVTANRDAGRLAEVARRLGARHAVVADEAQAPELQAALAGSGIRVGGGQAALEEAAAEPVEVVLSAIVGAAGLRATAAAVRAGSNIALANKECLICAGEAFMALVRRHGVRVLPVDSEHNAVFQLIEGRDPADVESVTITASGGPFRTWPAERLARATPAEALAHPTWSMGAKISIDSATLMNKGLELIEARHLFQLAPERLEVLVHPQSVVHALITFRDGSMHAEIGAADMRRPIAYCLYWPERPRTAAAKLDLAALGRLSFEAPDLERFPALALARQALGRGEGAPTVLNAANEIAVNAFLAGRIGFAEIAVLVGRTIEAADAAGLLAEPDSIETALELDGEARQIAARSLQVAAPAAT